MVRAQERTVNNVPESICWQVFWIVFFDCIFSLPGPNHAGVVCDGADPVHNPVLRLQRQVLYRDDNLHEKI
jgi:hypothetical protein